MVRTVEIEELPLIGPDRLFYIVYGRQIGCYKQSISCSQYEESFTLKSQANPLPHVLRLIPQSRDTVRN